MNLERKYLPVSELKFDTSYNRDPRETALRVKALAAKWDIRLVGTIVVSCREDGQYVVVDGQHRVLVAKLLGINELFCEIHHGLELKDEARLFHLLNGKDRIPLKSADLLKAMRIAEDENIVRMFNVLRAYGLEIGTNKNPRTIVAIKALMSIVRRHGLAALDRALNVVVRAWNGSPESLSGDIVSGVDIFLETYFGKVHMDRLITKLRSTEMYIINRMVGGDTTNSNKRVKVARAIWRIYNHNTRENRLEDKLENAE